jgi:hypothetical protein
MGANETRTADGSTLAAASWGVVFLLVVLLAVPWFMWRSARVAYGLPLWLWWHIGWMAFASIVFYAFGRTAWGIGVDP